jgi:hypothetical protein
MPLQNRVTPFGELVASPARGLFTGNRGIIHDPATKTLLSRRWSSKAWIVCSCNYKGIRRNVWAGQSWTELFFLDEATALAAGHRPCFRCRREAAKSFREAWAVGNGIAATAAAEMDAVLHRERLDGGAKRLHPLPAGFPEGTMLAAGNDAFLVSGGTLWQWSLAGYTPAAAPRLDGLITPPSTLAALAAGYRPMLHPSALGRPEPSPAKRRGEGEPR